jgi:hypothetical protein
MINDFASKFIDSHYHFDNINGIPTVADDQTNVVVSLLYSNGTTYAHIIDDKINVVTWQDRMMLETNNQDTLSLPNTNQSANVVPESNP